MNKFLRLLDEQQSVHSNCPERTVPNITQICQENRSFLLRSVQYMLKQGVTQFVDIGSGDPSLTYEVVRSVFSCTKVAYIDISKPLKQGPPPGTDKKNFKIISGNIFRLKDIFNHPDLFQFIDFSQPVGIMMMFIPSAFTDLEIRQVMSAVNTSICEGSYVALTHYTLDGYYERKTVDPQVHELFTRTSVPVFSRNHSEVCEIFSGLDIVQPGVVFLDEWPSRLDHAVTSERWHYGGIGKKHEQIGKEAMEEPHNFDVGELQKIASSALFFVLGVFLKFLWEYLVSELKLLDVNT
jgi:S-adenosyl methyltransferase